MSCPFCAQVRINGVRCHAQGCPDAWRDEARECRWCGGEFKPAAKGQGCWAAYNGYGYDPERTCAGDGT